MQNFGQNFQFQYENSRGTLARKKYQTKEAENECGLGRKTKYSETVRFQGTIGNYEKNIL